MDAQKLIKSLKAYPFAVVSAILSVILIGVIYVRSPIAEGLESTQQELERKVSLFDNNQRRAVDLDAHLAAGEALLESVEERLLEPENKTENSRFFWEIAERRNATRPDVSGETYVAAGKTGLKLYGTMSYSLRMNALFEDVFGYLQAVENGRFITRVDSISIKPAAQSGLRGTELQAKITILAQPE